jgi:branched-chain amino acid transport system substrate-binding protein
VLWAWGKSIVCVAAAAGLAGCAGATTTASTVTGSTLKVYAGQPPGGAGGQQTQDVLDGERLALQQLGNQVGHFKVQLESLSGGRVSDNARTVIKDSNAIAYLGELAPHSSADSIGITNAVGILQISPTDTAIELTQRSQAVPNSPTRYYESLSTYGRTFGRVVPAGTSEAAAQVRAMRAMGVTKLYVAADGGPYGSAIALAVKQDATKAGITVTSSPTGADAMFLGANDPVIAARRLNAAGTNPLLKLFVPSALDDDAFAARLSAAAQHGLYASEPGFMATGRHADVTPSGRKFLSDFKTAYGHDAGQSAIFGYEAMALVLDVLHRAGSSAGSRSAVVSEFIRTKQRASVLGTYSINGDGDTSLAPYVLSHFKAGKLVPFEAMQG